MEKLISYFNEGIKFFKKEKTQVIYYQYYNLKLLMMVDKKNKIIYIYEYKENKKFIRFPGIKQFYFLNAVEFIKQPIYSGFIPSDENNKIIEKVKYKIFLSLKLRKRFVYFEQNYSKPFNRIKKVCKFDDNFFKEIIDYVLKEDICCDSIIHFPKISVF